MEKTEAFLNKLDSPKINWLWHFLTNEPVAAQEYGIQPTTQTPQHLSVTNIRSVICNIYKDDHQFKDRINLAIEVLLLTDIDLQWIKTADERLCNWLLHKLANDQSSPFYQPSLPATPNATYYNFNQQYQQPVNRQRSYPPPSLSPRPREMKIADIIHSLHCWTTPRSRKKIFLEQLMCGWFQTKLIDKYLNWIDRENLEQCAWAWSYLETKSLASILLAPIANNGFYTSVMSVFDNLIPSPSEKQRLANSMRNAWSKQIRRSGEEGIRQFNCEITALQREKLDAIATVRGISASKTVAALIEMEHVKLQELGTLKRRQ
jgi:hypothetical protein